jgi:sulfur-oxidizing protein SoxY
MTRSKRIIHWFFYLLFYVCNGLFVAASNAATIVDQWEAIKSAYFNDQTVLSAQDKIQIEAPAQAENAAIVPFTFQVSLNKGSINKIYVFTDANPILLTATFTMKAQQKAFNLSTRIRLDKNSVVRVIAQKNDGRMLMKTVDIKTPGGGCGGGAMSDEARLRASAGEMKMRFIQPNLQQPARFVLNIKHPMRTGFERTFQGYYAKAWFIQHIDFSIDSQPYVHAFLGPGISADPYLKFNVPVSGEHVFQVDAKDNEGNVFQQAFLPNNSRY